MLKLALGLASMLVAGSRAKDVSFRVICMKAQQVEVLVGDSDSPFSLAATDSGIPLYTGTVPISLLGVVPYRYVVDGKPEVRGFVLLHVYLSLPNMQPLPRISPGNCRRQKRQHTMISMVGRFPTDRCPRSQIRSRREAVGTGGCPPTLFSIVPTCQSSP
jgi:hypothetical protein